MTLTLAELQNLKEMLGIRMARVEVQEEDLADLEFERQINATYDQLTQHVRAMLVSCRATLASGLIMDAEDPFNAETYEHMIRVAVYEALFLDHSFNPVTASNCVCEAIAVREYRMERG